MTETVAADADAGRGPDGRPRPTRLAAVVRPDAAFALLCAVAAIARYAILVEPGAPPGVDGGHWLSLGQALFGVSPRPLTVVYPPVIPVTVTAAVGLLGPVAGVGVVATMASLAPAAGAYVVLRAHRLGWIAAVLAALLIPVAGTGEATAWGGYPELVGIGLGLVALDRLDRHLRAPTRRGAVSAGVTLALVLATSHFVGAIVVVASAFLVALHWLLLRRVPEAAPPAGRPRLGLLALPSLALLPMYAILGRALFAGYRSRPDTIRVSIGTLFQNIEFVYRDLPFLWRPAAAVAAVTPLLAGPARRRPLWLIATSLLGSAALVLVLTREPRCADVVPAVVILTVGFWLDALGRLPRRVAGQLRAGATVVLVGALVLASVSGLRLFQRQRAYYGMLTPGLVEGIAWLAENSPDRATVAATSVNDAPLGWWVEGLGRRRTLSASPLQWLYLQDERDEARAANRIFGPDFPDERSLADARAAGARYLFVAKRWDGYIGSRAARYFSIHPALVVFQNRAVVIVDLDAERAGPSG